jgi:hypothetical protein
MRNIIIIIVMVLFIVSNHACTRNTNSVNEGVEKDSEIISHEKESLLETHRKQDFALQKIFTIDTEDRKFVELGIRRIYNLDIDLKKNILISDGKGIWKFDKNGDFVQKIGSSGQGPGEFRNVECLRVTSSNSISIYDPSNQKFLLFYPNGKIEKEIKLKNVFTYKGVFLDNGYFMILKRKEMPKEAKRMFYYSVFDKEFNEVKTLEPRYSIDLLDRSLKFNLMSYSISFQVANDLIYIGSNMNKHIQIYVYDLFGNLKRIIKQKVKSINLTKQYKKAMLQKWQNTQVWDTLRFKYYFPRFFPPFKSFWVDEEIGIFVEQFADSGNPDKCMVDWFSFEGTHIKRMFLEKARIRRSKNEYMYFVSEKESGFSKIEIYKIKPNL